MYAYLIVDTLYLFALSFVSTYFLLSSADKTHKTYNVSHMVL